MDCDAFGTYRRRLLADDCSVSSYSINLHYAIDCVTACAAFVFLVVLSMSTVRGE